MEIPADSKVHIIIRCPQCGGTLDFLEEAQVIHCNFCGSNLLVAGREGVLRYVLPPRISEARKAQTLAVEYLQRSGKRSPRTGETFLFYAPFWRIQGIVYRWVFGLKPLKMEVEACVPPPMERFKVLQVRVMDHTIPGYRPYVWARHTEAPFAPLAKPLAQSRVTVITTASPWRDDKPVDGVLRGDKQVWSGEIETTPGRLYTDDLAWDKEATHTRDVESFLPLARLREFAAAGRIGGLARRFHGVPTDYSQRRTLEQDAPEVLARCREDAVDVALLVPL